MQQSSNTPGSILKTVTRPPGATRMMNGMANMGYTPQTALADLIDNSIAAGATKIHINHSPKFGSKSVVYIADNGCGMDEATLISAMDYGADVSLKNSDLSVYGIGMKTASTAFSRKFTVISRGKNGKSSCYSWDLDRQGESPWGLDEVVPTKSLVSMLENAAGNSTGTVVMWDAAELKLADPIQRQTLDDERMIQRIDENIKEHLKLVFHRFMAGESRSHEKIDIFYNNELLVPWDPFNRDFLLEGWFMPEEKFEHEYVDSKTGEKTRGKYSIQAFLLDPESEGRQEAHKQSRLAMNFQGFYVYREDRLIDLPNWLSFRATTHNSLNTLRFKFEIDASLDTANELTVRKDKISLPKEMFAHLLPIYRKYSAEAEDRNRKRRKAKKVAATPENLHEASSAAIQKHRNDIPMPIVERVNRTDVMVQNQYGSNVIRIRDITEQGRPENFVIPVKQLDDGVLYEPLFNGKDITIQLNQGHEFYQKVYLSFFKDPLAIEALDNVLWAFARAELNAAANIRTQFVELRTLVSQYLRHYAEEKESPELLDGIDDDEDAG